ncbi:9417_t:CDS:2 [Gigaspora margarita]|uniref:9417_t:CDS:1 n=1 Tax=Gigaspora margarita TaxID=4874 RepID=A0ABN7WKL4_GIGMA|nr:9417_t:CDS:2 [Gigaspora margarita]
MITKNNIAKEIGEKVKKLKVCQKGIYKARKLENNLAYKQKIESYIEKRYNNFTNNTKKMINSILQRHKALVIINSIAYENYMITDPKEIKQTKYNPKNEEAWANWKKVYKSKEVISSSWYEELEKQITIKELEETIKEALTKKATGPQTILNKMIKRTNKKARSKILEIMNICLMLQTIPKN